MAFPLIPQSHLDAHDRTERRFRLLQQVRLRLRELQYSRRTEDVYAWWVRAYVIYHGRRHPREMGAVEVAAFLAHLAEERRMAASTRNQARAALQFLYVQVLRQPPGQLDAVFPAFTPPRVPVILTVSEVRTILEQLEGAARLCAMLMYGSGLRLPECVRLRVRDVDLTRREIVVRPGGGGKERKVPIAESCLVALERQLGLAAARAGDDVRAGVRRAGITEAMRQQYPDVDSGSRWCYVFPARRTLAASAGGRLRPHMHETVVQRAVNAAMARAGITQRATCHAFRHSFATHLLATGSDIRTVQGLLGHTDVRTTMVYARLLSQRGPGAKSPADLL